MYSPGSKGLCYRQCFKCKYFYFGQPTVFIIWNQLSLSVYNEKWQYWVLCLSLKCGNSCSGKFFWYYFFDNFLLFLSFNLFSELSLVSCWICWIDLPVFICFSFIHLFGCSPHPPSSFHNNFFVVMWRYSIFFFLLSSLPVSSCFHLFKKMYFIVKTLNMRSTLLADFFRCTIQYCEYIHNAAQQISGTHLALFELFTFWLANPCIYPPCPTLF